MTKFDELMEIITRNKNKNKNKNKKPIPPPLASNQDDDEDEDIEIEVSGAESKEPLITSASEDLDPDIIDMLYRSNRNRVPRGEGASSWDSDY